MSSSPSSSSADLTSEAEAAKQELSACEKEISAIKSVLRTIGPSQQTTEEDNNDDPNKNNNTLKVYWVKIEHLPEAAAPRLSLQLSSPVEELTLESFTEPVVFRGVETGQATLVCSAFDQDIPLGTSQPCDLAPLCKVSVMEAAQESYETIVHVPLFATGDSSETDIPICTATLKFVFVPSKKDRREELYELLNQCSQRKAAAVEKLRQSAVAASRQQMVVSEGNSNNNTSSNSSSNNSVVSKPAVRPGFLNKPIKKEPSKIVKLYRTYLGPDSLMRTILWPTAQNYIIFSSFCLFMHYKGPILALPAPV